MRVLAFSDYHAQKLEHLLLILDEVDVDLVLYAGDALNKFIEDERNYFEEIANRTSKNLFLGIAGNDTTNPLHSIYHSEHVKDIHREPHKEENIAFIGLDGRAHLPAFLSASKHTSPLDKSLREEEEKRIERHLQKQLEKCRKTDKIILVSHLPPKGILDTSIRFKSDSTGSEAVRQLTSADLIVCGHTHSQGGRAQHYNDKTALNASIRDDKAELALDHHEYKNGQTVLNVASDDYKPNEGCFALIEINNTIHIKLSTTRKHFQEHKDPLLHLSQVGHNRLLAMKKAGIKTLSDINTSNKTTLQSLPGSSEWHANRWIREAHALQQGNIILEEAFAQRIQSINQPLTYDIETDLGGNRVWLIGIHDIANDQFTQLFEKDNEQKLLQDLTNHLKQHKNKTLISYSACRFEQNTLQAALKRHNLEDTTGLLENEIDLGIEFMRNIIGAKHIGLKKLEKQFEYQRADKDIDGMTVGTQYTKYLNTGQEPNWERLKQYNKEDVYAVTTILTQLQKTASKQ